MKTRSFLVRVGVGVRVNPSLRFLPNDPLFDVSKRKTSSSWDYETWVYYATNYTPGEKHRDRKTLVRTFLLDVKYGRTFVGRRTGRCVSGDTMYRESSFMDEQYKNNIIINLLNGKTHVRRWIEGRRSSIDTSL